MCKLGDERIEAKATNGYLETVDISELLNVSYQTVYSFIKSGRLKADDISYVGSRQRKKIETEKFKDFLRSNPKYYARVYGEIIQKEEPVICTVDEPEEKEPIDVLTELFNKYESIDGLIAEHEKEIEKLKAQKEALKQVIEMF